MFERFVVCIALFNSNLGLFVGVKKFQPQIAHHAVVMNSRRECLVFPGHSRGNFKRVVCKAGETAARSNYVISADANIVGDWWSQHVPLVCPLK